ncbi:MAG: trypsin-like peptidase domain-containing protein [Myxococcales bacterium]|nr:trypsin-like peptidase domain-containing protein [Myxococcales bacterium]
MIDAMRLRRGLFAGLTMFGVGLGSGGPVGAQPRPRAGAVGAAPREAGGQAAALSRAFAETASRVLPSVVALYVELGPRQGAVLEETNGFWGAPPQDAQRRSGSGSGVILRGDGVILTNNHVVDEATRIRVRLHDGRTFPARVLGVDPATDLAVLKIEATGLSAARLGDSDAASVGEFVLAIGAPFGLEATVTHGVLSAMGRGGLGVNLIEDYLQTDASINPGNSGGALVNLRGELLGVNTMVVGRGQGIGFAVPVQIARWVAEQIVARGRVTRGWIGVSVQDLSPDLAALGAPGSGALVNVVDPRGPAHAAGLRVGDVIVSIDQLTVRNRHDVLRGIASRAVGDALSVVVSRGRTRETLRITASLRPGEAPPASGPPPGPASDPRPRDFGMRIDAVPPFLAQRLGLEGAAAVVIVEVLRGGAADRAGLRPGDVILQADGQPARDTDVVVEAARDGRAVLLIRRGALQEFVGLEIATGAVP